MFPEAVELLYSGLAQPGNNKAAIHCGKSQDVTQLFAATPFWHQRLVMSKPRGHPPAATIHFLIMVGTLLVQSTQQTQG